MLCVAHGPTYNLYCVARSIVWPTDLRIIILCTYVHSVAHLIQVEGTEIKLLGTGRRRMEVG